MILTKEEKNKVWKKFEKFINDIDNYNIREDIKIYLDLYFDSNKNNRYNYISIRNNYDYKNNCYKKEKFIFALGDDLHEELSKYKKEIDGTLFLNTKEILDIMNNKDAIFRELEKHKIMQENILKNVLDY